MHPFLSPPTPRAFTRSLALWLFGLCTTLMLIGLWGRAVTTDETTLADSARAVLQSELLNRRLDDWLTSALTEAGSVAPGTTEGLVATMVASPELDRAIDALVDSVVEASLAPPDQVSRLDLAPAVEQLEPAIDRALAHAGAPIDASTVTSGLGDLSLTSRDLALASRGVGGARVFLTQVVLIAGVGLLLTGGAAIRLSDDRLDQVRSLCWRIALSGFTFSLILRLGAWAVDPSGGRSPLAAGGAVILRSNLHIPVVVTLGAVIAGLLFLVRRRRSVDVPAEDSTGEHPVLIDA